MILNLMFFFSRFQILMMIELGGGLGHSWVHIQLAGEEILVKNMPFLVQRCRFIHLFSPDFASILYVIKI